MERLSPATEIELAMQMSTPYASDSILLSPPSVTQHGSEIPAIKISEYHLQRPMVQLGNYCSSTMQHSPS